MNRLTWSGVALHAGQLPGYPASHGCLRLPAMRTTLTGVLDFSVVPTLMMTKRRSENSKGRRSPRPPGGQTAKENGEDHGVALRRVGADPATREALHKRLRFGTTVVTTDEPANAKKRSTNGFVVIDSAS